MSNALGLKYIGQREEGILVMLFKSYKTIKLSKLRPYKFTSKDITTPDALNYYSKLGRLGVALITDEKDLLANPKNRFEARKEPMAAEVDTQIDTTAEIPQTSDISAKEVEESAPAEVVDATPAKSNKIEMPEDISQDELSEYLEMNFSKDQLKELVANLGLEISVGRKNASAIVGEIIASADRAALIEYLNK